MIQLGLLSSVMYTCCLSLHFLLSIRYKWSPSKLKNAHTVMHVACIGIPFLTAIVGLIATAYNPTPNTCYINSYPSDCNTTGAECIRGRDAKWYILFLHQVPIFVGLLFIIGSMVMMYLSLSSQDQEMSSFRAQAFCVSCQLVAGFSLAFIPLAVISTLFIFYENFSFALILIHSFLAPITLTLILLFAANASAPWQWELSSGR